MGGNQTIAPEENSPLVRVRVELRLLLGLGSNFLGGSCPNFEVISNVFTNLFEIFLKYFELV